MRTIQQTTSVAQFNTERGQETLHPLVSVLDQSKSRPISISRSLSALYIIFLKGPTCAALTYGRSHYDYDDGTLLFIAPGQVFGFDESKKAQEDTRLQPTGWVLLFHPDLIRGTSLGQHIREYNFFAYDVNEALHLSEREKGLVLDCFANIRHELEHPVDTHSRRLVVSHIELFLNYCVRFYDRQFISRDTLHKGVLVGFERVLDDYFQSNKPQTTGLPSVGYCADQFHLSANYFGDLVRKETGKSAQEYIQERLIDMAKEKVLDTSKAISEIAYELGFKHPPHFTRLFKQRVGLSPKAYRQLN